MADYQNLVTSSPITTVPPASPDTDVVWYDGVNYYLRTESGVDNCISCQGSSPVLLEDFGGPGVKTMAQTWNTYIANYKFFLFTARDQNNRHESATVYSSDMLNSGRVNIFHWVNNAIWVVWTDLTTTSATVVDATLVANSVKMFGFN